MPFFETFFLVLVDFKLIAFIALAVLVGTLAGAMPGLTAAATVALFLPITFGLDPIIALAFLYVIGKASRFGGSLSAILFNTPGTAASVVTQLDGYPLAQRGQSGKAIQVAAISSVFGDFLGEVVFLFVIVAFAGYVLKLGPPEVFTIYLLAFVISSSIVSTHFWKGVISTALGVLIAMIGTDPISGRERFTFNIIELSSGVELVPLIIGVFVFSEVLAQYEKTKSKNKLHVANLSSPSAHHHALTWRECKSCLPFVTQGSFIGVLIGMLPGVGSAIAALTSYATGKRFAKNKQRWGKGAIEGVASAESANNAVSGPSMAPLLLLGVPGSTIGAVLIGAFTLHGVQIGPTLLFTSQQVVFQLIACGFIGIIFYGVFGYFAAPKLAKIVSALPTHFIYPIIFLTCFVAAYANRSDFFDMKVMIVAGLFGWLMRKFSFSTPAFVIAFVIAKGADEAFQQSLLMSDNGILIFFERPFAFIVTCLIVVILICRLIAEINHYRIYSLHSPKDITK